MDGFTALFRSVIQMVEFYTSPPTPSPHAERGECLRVEKLLRQPPKSPEGGLKTM